MFMHTMIDRIGELTTQLFMIRNIYDELHYDLTIITQKPESVPALNKAVYDIAMRGVEVIHVDPRDPIWQHHGQTTVHNDITCDFSNTLQLTIKFWNSPISRQPDYFFSLNSSEIHRGQVVQKAFGIPDNAKIVTLHVRDGAYFDYCSSDSYRNSNILNYYPAIKYLISNGYYIVRIGDKKMTPIHVFGPNFVDAPFHEAYSDIVEPYFIGRSIFHIGTPSGPSGLASTFGVPTLFTNHNIIGHNSSYYKDLLLFRKYFSHMLNRFLTYEEILASPALDFCRTRHFVEAGIELVENSAEEILAGAIEMIRRLEGSYPDTSEMRMKYRQIKRIEARCDYFRRQPRDPMPATYVPLYSLLHSQANISYEYLKMNPFFVGHIWPQQVKFDWEPEFSY